MIQLGGKHYTYNILIEFGITRKLVGLIKITYSIVRIGKTCLTSLALRMA
jgi:hypothetical protein